MRTVLLLAMALIVAISGESGAQRRSSRGTHKGIPCGNSYIAANKTCHIGAPASVDTTTKIDTTHVSAAASPAQVLPAQQATAVRSPTTTPSATSDLATALGVLWNHPVVIKNSSMPAAQLAGAVLKQTRNDHVVVTVGVRELHIPFTSMEMYYEERDIEGTVVIVLRK